MLHQMIDGGESTECWAIRQPGFIGSLRQLTSCARCGEPLREAEREVWLAAARSGFKEEWRFAWKIELILQRTFARLEAIGPRVTP